MKQLVQWPDTGDVEVISAADPQLADGVVVVRTHFSAVSPGTERAMVEFGKSSMLAKARARPDLVRRVVEKARTEGLVAAFDATRRRLKDPTLLGYSCAGEVVRVGKGISDFRVGDRVACGGAGFACHASMVAVPRQLVVRVPDVVPLADASFAVIATIPMHGFRLAEVGLRDTVAVIGLGLIGQLACQIAIGAGARVVAYDPSEDRCAMAGTVAPQVKAFSSAQEAQALLASATQNLGADAVLICAATSSSDPISLAADMARDRGHVVMVGSTGMDVPRRPFFDKELTFQVSRSYGPGRYDADYEERGRDYPAGYVKWTEGRNIAAALDMMAEGTLQVQPLIDRFITLDDAVHLYEDPADLGSSLGVAIGYEVEDPSQEKRARRIEAVGAKQQPLRTHGAALTLGVVGAGQFARTVLLPAIAKAGGYRFRAVSSGRGVSAAAAQRQFGFERLAESLEDILSDSSIGTVVITTRHDLHADQIVAALESGKRVFVEKPIAITEEGLSRVAGALDEGLGPLYVGYNRRFAPMIRKVRAALEGLTEPAVVTYRANVGHIPADHWIQVPEEGGGRIIGEACHFIDLMSLLAQAKPVSVAALATPNEEKYSGDNVVATIGFENGAIGTLCYTAAGDRAGGKERLEVYQSGTMVVLDDYRTLHVAAGGRLTTSRARLRQDKGHVGEWQVLKNALLGGVPLISHEDLLSGALCTFRIGDALRSHQVERVEWRRGTG